DDLGERRVVPGHDGQVGGDAEAQFVGGGHAGDGHDVVVVHDGGRAGDGAHQPPGGVGALLAGVVGVGDRVPVEAALLAGGGEGLVAQDGADEVGQAGDAGDAAVAEGVEV